MATYKALQTEFKTRKQRARLVCPHVGGETYISNGLVLKCCTGSGARCKLNEIDYLTAKLVQKCDEIDDLKEKLSRLEGQISAPKVVNKTTNITINNTYNILAAQGLDIVRIAWQGGKSGPSLYEIAFKQLQKSAPSEDSKRLLRLATSGDVLDRLTFQREVIDGVDQVLPQLPEQVQREADVLLDLLSKQTNQEAIENGLEVE